MIGCIIPDKLVTFFTNPLYKLLCIQMARGNPRQYLDDYNLEPDP